MNNVNSNTMNNNDNTNDNSNSNSSLASGAIMSTPAVKYQPGTAGALYKLAARNLREYHGVPSMTSLKIEKTVALLRLAPRRVVVQGLAPRRLLNGDRVDSNADILAYNNCSEEEKGGSDGSDCLNDVNINNNTKEGGEVGEVDGSGTAKRPIHAALIAGGINLRPRETRPLLRALGVRPHRLVRLGLVTREVVRAMPGRRGGGPGQRQHLRAGGPRQGDVDRPRGPPRGRPHDHSGRPMHAPPRPFHGDGRHIAHLGEESGGEDMSAPLGPHGDPGHRGPRHQGGRRQEPPRGPGHHSMSPVRHGRGAPGGGKHRRGHRHPPYARSESGGGEGKRLHGVAPAHEQHRPRRRLAGGIGRAAGRPHGPFRGPFRTEGASGAPRGMMADPHHDPQSRGGGMKRHGGRHGGTGFCGGGRRQPGRMAHPAHLNGRDQPHLET